MTQRKRYSEALKKVALDCENKQIVLQAMSEIVLEDKNYIENTIVKIATHTNLSREMVCEVFKDMRLDEELIKKIHKYLGIKDKI